MPKKEREAKKAAFAMKQELDSEMSEEQRERMEKSGMGIGGGLNKGEDQLFGTRLLTASAAARSGREPLTRALCQLGREPCQPACL